MLEKTEGTAMNGQYIDIDNISDLRQVGGFLQVLRFPPPNKTDHHDITVNMRASASSLWYKMCT